MNHDPLCGYDWVDPADCQACQEYATVRADEREQAAQRVEALEPDGVLTERGAVYCEALHDAAAAVMTGQNWSAGTGRTVAPADCSPGPSQSVGRTTHWWEYFTDRRKPVVPPSSASWTAACPQCRRDADWHSEASQSVIRYTLDCRVCGVTRWGGAV